MMEDRICETCGNVIPAHSPGGSCLTCALKTAFTDVDDLEGRTIGLPPAEAGGTVLEHDLVDRIDAIEVARLLALGAGQRQAPDQTRRREIDHRI